MEKHGFSREKYSCIYTLSKNAGSKYIRLFTDADADNTIVFDGSCKTSLSARANPQTKQFQESILRLKRRQNPESPYAGSFHCRMEMHFLSEKERRELNAQRRDERDKVGVSRELHVEQAGESRPHAGRKEDAKGARYSHSEWRHVTGMDVDGDFPSRRRCVKS